MIFISGNEQDGRITEVKIRRRLTSEHDEINRLFFVYWLLPETEWHTANRVPAVHTLSGTAEVTAASEEKWATGCTTPRIVLFCIRRRWVFSFIVWPRCYRENSLLCRCYCRLSGIHCWPRRCGKEKRTCQHVWNGHVTFFQLYNLRTT